MGVYPPRGLGFSLINVVDLALTALLSLCRSTLDDWHYDDNVVAGMIAAFDGVSQDLVGLGSSVATVYIIDVTKLAPTAARLSLLTA